MRKLYLYAAMLIAVTSSYSQKLSKLTSTEIYWIKPLETSIPSVKEILNPDCLNFNRRVSFSELKIPQHIGSIIAKKSSLFIVFKSSAKGEVELINFSLGLSKGSITNLKLTTEADYIFDKADPKPGVLVSHLFTRNSIISKRKGGLGFSEALFNDKDGINSLYEFIYLPEFLGEKQQNIIETYLSVKYGISKVGDKDYINSVGDTIWNYKENATYSHRITGIGRDDENTLYQKQSRNSVNDGLYIGLGNREVINSQNKSTLSNKSYFLWGDNDKSIDFEKNTDSNVSSLKRIWRVNKTNSDTLVSQVIINKRLMKLEHKPNVPGDNIYLLMDHSGAQNLDFANAEFVKATEENDSLLIYNNVRWTHPQYLFTLAKAPDLILNYATRPSCGPNENGEIDLLIAGGTPPYNVILYSDTYNKDFFSEQRDLNLKNLPNGVYTIDIKDKLGKSQKNTVALDPFYDEGGNFPTRYVIVNSHPLDVIPPLVSDEGTQFSWSFNNKEISKENHLVIDTAGNYVVSVTTASGCSKEFPFTVRIDDETFSRMFSVYPNPCKENELFTVQISQPEVKDTNITITDINGKIIYDKNLGKISEAVYKNSLTTQATYIIIVTSGTDKHTAKIIIQ